jgi:hypothetical protein
MDTPRRQWEISNPRYQRHRVVFSALSKWRPIILAGRFEICPHARGRMAERRIALHQLLATVRFGEICHFGSGGDCVYGGYLHHDLMVFVESDWPRETDFSDLIPTVKTVYEVDPLPASRKLTAPLGDLMHA